jgi:hypothetical protein
MIRTHYYVQQAVNIYRIITDDFHDIFFHQESGSTGSEEEVGPNSMPRGSAQDSHPVQGTCEVSSLD